MLVLMEHHLKKVDFTLQIQDIIIYANLDALGLCIDAQTAHDYIRSDPHLSKTPMVFHSFVVVDESLT